MRLPLLWASYPSRSVSPLATSADHMQLYCDCPVQRLTFPIEHMESPASERCLSPPHTAAVRSGAVATEVQDCLETESLNAVPQDDTKHFQVALIISQNPLGHRVPV